VDSGCGLASRARLLKWSQLFGGCRRISARPFHMTWLWRIVRRVLQQRASGTLGEQTTGACLIGDHPAMRWSSNAWSGAESGASVLVRGDEGTGRKSLPVSSTPAERAGRPLCYVRPGTARTQRGHVQPEAFWLARRHALSDTCGLSARPDGLLRVMRNGKACRILGRNLRSWRHDPEHGTSGP